MTRILCINAATYKYQYSIFDRNEYKFNTFFIEDISVLYAILELLNFQCYTI
jgi:hypothetical protein